jgi:CP family cyanate transporter-like MFS transporter
MQTLTLRQGLARAAILLLLWLTGIYMRAPILIASPLGDRIRAEMAFGQTGLGALTTLPVLLLGLGAIPAAWLIGRFGARPTLIAALLLTAIASMLRGLAPNLAVLLGFTALTGLGIAAMQAALPALVGRLCPGFVALGSAIYINGMMLGEFIGAGLTLPVLLPAVGDDWRHLLLVFSLPAIILCPLLLRLRLHGPRASGAIARKVPDLRDPVLWRFGLLLGATSSTFFGVNAYMGALLDAKGLGSALSQMLFLFNLTQLVISLVMVAATRQMLRIPRLLGLTSAGHVVGLAVFIGSDALASLWIAAILLSLTSALQLITITALPPLLRDPDEAGRLAAGILAVGYVLGFTFPLIAGLLADITGSPYAVIGMFFACNMIALPIAWGTRTQIDRLEQAREQ